MKHLHTISRMPATGSTTQGTAEVAVTFLIAILSAIQPLLIAATPLKAQQAKYAQEDIPDFP